MKFFRLLNSPLIPLSLGSYYSRTGNQDGKDFNLSLKKQVREQRIVLPSPSLPLPTWLVNIDFYVFHIIYTKPHLPLFNIFLYLTSNIYAFEYITQSLILLTSISFNLFPSLHVLYLTRSLSLSLSPFPSLL